MKNPNSFILILMSVLVCLVSTRCSLAPLAQVDSLTLAQTQEALQGTAIAQTMQAFESNGDPHAHQTAIAQSIDQTVQAWMPTATDTPVSKPPTDTPTVTPVTPSATSLPSWTPIPSLTPIASLTPIPTATVILRVCAQAGCKAPDFTLTSVKDDPISLKAYQGKTVVLNFWTTWCPHCRAQIPDLVAVYNKYKSKGLVVLSVEIDNNSTKKKILNFANENGMDFPVMLDKQGTVSKLYQASSIPKTVFIDARGVIKTVAVGRIPRDSLEMQVSRLLAGY
ncbi:MAG: TlpA disulfide reductase family protein [Chloroflexota bacterium]